MARKRNRHTDGSSEASDSQEKYDSKSSCPHVYKGVDIGGLKRALKKRDDIKCHGCKRSLPSSIKAAGIESNLCVCMQCGYVGCSSSRNGHAVDHFTTPRSDCHSVVAVIDTWTLRCLNCKLDINLEVNAKAADAIAFLRKNLPGCMPYEEVGEEPCNITLTKKNFNNQSPVIDSKSTYRNCKEGKIYPVLGLLNLGNTCYLNSVLQCLAQTPRFVRSLESCCVAQSTFHLFGGDNLIHKDHGGYLPPLDGVLGEGGPLTKAVAKILQNLRSGEKLRKSGLLNENPGDIIRLMKKFSNTFYIGEQHDSHELLRILLESLRTEDLKRYQRGILNAMNISPSTKEVLPKEHECLKAYKNEAIQKHLAVEKLFGGTLVSLLKCLECETVTTSFETFMDISLSVESEKVRNIEKEVLASEQRISKHQLKKERKERKAAWRSKKKGRANRLPLDIQSAQPVIKLNQSSDDSGADSEADIEDNLDTENSASISQDEELKAQTSTDSATSYCCDDCEMAVDVAQYPETSTGEEKLYPYTALLFGSNSTRNTVPSMDRADAPSEQQVCRIQVRKDLMMPSCNPESSPLIYQYDGDCLSIRQELSPNEDYDSCEGGRGSTASSIDQNEWDDGREKTDLKVDDPPLTEEAEAALCVSLEASEIEPPEPFEYLSCESFKEGPLELTSCTEDSCDEKLPDICPPLDQCSVNKDHPMSSTFSEGDSETCSDEVTPRFDRVSSAFDAEKNIISGETLQIVVEEEEFSTGDSGSVKDLVSHRIKNNSSVIGEQLDGTDDVWGTTLAPPSELETVVHSLEHCLRQFFHEEMLSGTNRIGCTHCTHKGKGSSPEPNEKLLLTNALKQHLFLKLPEVLTIHLKRFEVLGTRMSKISRKITFPVELDVSPYTSAKFQTKQPDTAPCYHLFGVIEHMGHMSSGHYVAYVKVHEEMSKCSDSLGQISAHGVSFANHCPDLLGELPKKEVAQNNKLVDKWYYVSDTYVKEVSLKDVLAAEAYILFYRQQI